MCRTSSKRGLADALGADHGGDLLLALDGAQLCEEVARAAKPDIQLLFPAEETRVAELLILRRDFFRAELGKGLAQSLHKRVLLVELADLHALGLLFGGLDIAGVRDQEGLFFSYENCAVGKGETRRVALVLLVGDKQGVKAPAF